MMLGFAFQQILSTQSDRALVCCKNKHIDIVYDYPEIHRFNLFFRHWFHFLIATWFSDRPPLIEIVFLYVGLGLH